MKVLFNSSDFETLDYMFYRLNDIEDELYKHQDVFFATLSNTHVFRARNIKNGKPLIKLHTQFENSDKEIVIKIVIVQFGNITDMFQYLDSLSVFNV